MTYGNVSVTTSATLIIAANCSRTELQITNNSTADIYIGMDASVTTSNGLPLYGNQTRERSRGFGTYLGPVYGIIAASTADIRFWETTQ